MITPIITHLYCCQNVLGFCGVDVMGGCVLGWGGADDTGWVVVDVPPGLPGVP